MNEGILLGKPPHGKQVVETGDYVVLVSTVDLPVNPLKSDSEGFVHLPCFLLGTVDSVNPREIRGAEAFIPSGVTLGENASRIYTFSGVLYHVPLGILERTISQDKVIGVLNSGPTVGDGRDNYLRLIADAGQKANRVGVFSGLEGHLQRLDLSPPIELLFDYYEH